MKRNFFPLDGEQFFMVDWDLVVYKLDFDEANPIHVAMAEYGNAFRTEEDAQFDAERIRVKIELQRLADAANEEEQAASGEDPTEWDTVNNHYFIYYDCKEDWVRVNFEWDQKCDLIYFPSSDAAFAAINELGAERILRYYFGIEPESEEGGADE